MYESYKGIVKALSPIIDGQVMVLDSSGKKWIARGVRVFNNYLSACQWSRTA